MMWFKHYKAKARLKKPNTQDFWALNRFVCAVCDLRIVSIDVTLDIQQDVSSRRVFMNE